MRHFEFPNERCNLASSIFQLYSKRIEVELNAELKLA